MLQHQALLNGYKAVMTCDSLGLQKKAKYRYREIAARDIRTRIRAQIFG
jgi:hypothetical protein